jgi:hypothetical protein
MRPGSGGFAAGTKGTDFVFFTNTSPAVVAHELGHLADYVGGKPFRKPSLLTETYKPRYEKEVMGRERRAWEKGKPFAGEQWAKHYATAEPAYLSSYGKGFHMGRAGMLGGAGTLLGLAGTGALLHPRLRKLRRVIR